MQIFICPKATPGAMPQAKFRKFRIFYKIAPGFRPRLCPRANKNLHIPAGYAQGTLLHNICPQRVICKFLIASGLRRRLRLCPRANKNLHIPAGYAQSILLHNICLQGDMQIFICIQAMPRAFPPVSLNFATPLTSLLIRLYSTQRRGTPHTYLYLKATTL
ncbi:hypothetical protein T08_6094 [Trichinella sp. T8]|nr:hypothetical protein T08_6094 [Trichinella sp. T8]